MIDKAYLNARQFFRVYDMACIARMQAINAYKSGYLKFIPTIKPNHYVVTECHFKFKKIYVNHKIFKAEQSKEEKSHYIISFTLDGFKFEGTIPKVKP